MLNQPGFFDLMDRANKLTKLGDPSGPTHEKLFQQSSVRE